MKTTKILSFLLALLCVLTLTGCGGAAAPAAVAQTADAAADAPEESAEEAAAEPEAEDEPEAVQQMGADGAIESVTAIGFVDIDGVKLRAIAVKYIADLVGADITPDMFSIETASPKAPENLGSGQIGGITDIYINDEPAVSESGGSGAGKYVIIEVYSDYLSGSEQSFATALACSVKQTGILIGDKVMIAPNTHKISNYDGGGGKRQTLREDGFLIPDIEGFRWFTDHPGTYGADGPAFVAYDCFDEKSGESVECHLGYALCLPEDWHEGGRYAMVVLDNPATGESTHPIESTLETRSPAVYASPWAQELVKEKHGLDGLIVVVPVVTARVDDNACSPAEYEALVQLWDYLIETYGVDRDHVYGSGQSVGGMVLLETNRNRDNYFAGLMLYEDQWAQNYYKDTLFVRNQASDEMTASTAPMHYPRVKEYLTWDYCLDTDGNPVYEGHDPNNYYWLISDDNILIMNRMGNNLSNDTWRELAFLYEDLAGATVEQHLVSTKISIEERDEDVAAYLAEEGDTGIKWVSFESGSNGYTCRQIMAGYEWLLSQTRQTEIAREKLDINKPFEAAGEQIQTEERTLHFTDASGDPLYYITGKPGAGTQFYNTCWLNMATVADAAPGWLPEGMSWDKGVSGAHVLGAEPIVDGNGRLAAVAVEYDADMANLTAHLKGDSIIGLDGNVREDITIVLDPYEFYDGGTRIDCEITNIYVNDAPALRADAERGSGSGRYVIAVLDTASAAGKIGVKQVTTLRTDTLIASPGWKIY